MHETARAVHILAGSLGLITGLLALFVAKGGRVHRRSGKLFVYAMLTMGLMGSLMAAVWGKQPASNIPVGLLTAYLVTTGLTTVRPPTSGSRGFSLGLMVLAFALGLALFAGGFVAVASPGGMLLGVPAVPFFILGSIALLAGIGDLRWIRAGGAKAIRSVPRITRHLWRMCLALLVASLSIGQVKAVIPKLIRGPLLLGLPLVVLAALLYWLWRVRLRRSFRGVVVNGTPEAPMVEPVTLER
jgi:hypothetical protein